MSLAIELLYHEPRDLQRETRVSAVVSRHGGLKIYLEEPGSGESRAITVTYEFNDTASASGAAKALQEMGEHVEGPYND